MKFGQRIRDLRRAKNLGQRALAKKIGISFTYVSKIENHQLDFGEYPSNELIRRLAKALDADEDELLLLAEKIPEQVRVRVLQRPDAFCAFAACDDDTLDRLMIEIGEAPAKPRPAGSNR
jgi:HTH-type transcriptional regulator, competence development regulator